LVHLQPWWEHGPDQPAPAWLWQIGCLLAAAGGLAGLGAVAGAPAWEGPPSLPKHRRVVWWLAATLVAFDAMVLLGAAVSTHSTLRGQAILLAVIVTIAALVSGTGRSL
jgi:hypothetical protein